MVQTKHAGQKHMVEGPIVRNLLVFMLPILCSQFLQQFYNICDTAMVGRLVSARALAAVGSAGLLISVVINFIIGLSTGISVMTSQLFGKREYEKLTYCIQTVLVSIIVIGIVMTVLGFFFSRQFLMWLNTPEDIIPIAETYLRISLIGVTAQLIYNTANACLRSLGNTRSALYYLAICAGINLVLDYLLIGTAGLGIAGAAIATVIAQFISAFLVLYRLYHLEGEWKPKPIVPIIGAEYLRDLLTKGVPSGMQAVFMSISSLVIQTYISSFGYSAIAGMTVYARVEGFLYYPLFSFGLALTSFIGQNTGAGRIDRVEKGIRISIALTTSGCIAAALITGFAAQNILRLFTDDPAILHNGMQAVVYTFPFYWLYAINQVYIGGIRGLGNTTYPMITSLCSYCIFRVMWCWLWDFKIHDMRVVYSSYDVSWVIMLVLLYFGYKTAVRKYSTL